VKKKILLISLAVVLAISMGILGCTTPSEEEEEEPPVKETLVVALSTLHEETFLPWNGGLARIFYMDCIYETLTFIDPETLEAVPGLAEDWEVSEDAMTWTFYLREGTQFHEGWGEVTAEDVKYSIERVIAEDSIVGPASPMRALIDYVEAPETYKVVVHLNNPDPILDEGYMSQANPVWVVCKDYVETEGEETANDHPIGTGPYTLKSYSPGYSIELEAVADHWRVTPDFKYIKFVKSPEDATRVAMLKAGEADLVPISYDSIPEVEAAGLNVLSVPNSWSPYFVFGGTVPARPERWNPDNPWSDVEVRKALNMAIDKQTIVDTIFHGQAEVAGAQSYTSAWKDIEPWFTYNPTEAINLLDAAGYSDGFPILLKAFTTSPGAELPAVAEAVATYWEAIGLEVEVQIVDYRAVVRPEWTTDQALDYIFTHRGMSMMDPVAPCKSAFFAGSAFSVYADEDTEALLADINASADAAERQALATEMGEVIRDKVAIVPIAFCNEPYGASEYVGNWPSLSVTVTNIYKITRP
jgi:peptide/nickel transport system substrate-binding protein